MNGNATHRFTNTAMLTVQTADASQVITSDALDERLDATYRRVGLRPGLLERLAGIRERRWWADGVSFVDGAATAGAKAIRSEEHTSELQSRQYLVCRLLLEKKKT